MKRLSSIIMLALLIPFCGISQNKGQIIDDIYFKPGQVTVRDTNSGENQKSTYKNGAKQIIFIERSPNNVGKKNTANAYSKDSTAKGDSIIASQDSLDSGYYLNGFNGSKSDYEYAERIRRFHNPKYRIFIGDPGYYDIYFLDKNDWNVYVDGSYAYVTPTWTNPYWWNYHTNPYYGWSNGYGYYGYGYGYGWPYYGYGPFGYDPYYYSDYYGYYGGYGYWNCYGGYPYYCGYSYWNNKHQRNEIGSSSAVARSIVNRNQSSYRSGATSAERYTMIGNRSNADGYTVSRNVNLSTRDTQTGYNSGRSNTRTTTLSRSNMTSGREGRISTSNTGINTQPRTAIYNSEYRNNTGSRYSQMPIGVRSGNTSDRGYRSGATGNGNMATRNATPTYNTGSSTRTSITYRSGTPTTNYYRSSSNSNSRNGTSEPSYTPSYTPSSSQPYYNSGGSSSSRSSSTSSGGGYSSGGSRSGGSGGGGSVGGGRR